MAEYVRDDYARTVASGWGNADVGGAYTEAMVAGITASVQAGRLWSTIAMTGTAAGPVYERLAAATAAADVAIAAAIRVTIALPTDHVFTLQGRVSGAVGDPVCYGARVTITAAGAMTLDLVRIAAGGAATVLASQAYAAGTYVLAAQWRVELQLNGSKLRARLYPIASIPAGGNGWITAGDETLTAAGTYGARFARTAPGASATSWAELGDLFASDIPQPAFTATPTGLSVAFNAAPSTGDFTAYSWAWGDGTAAGSGSTPTHVYAAAGSYLVTLTGTTRWGATFTGQAFVSVAAPPPPAPPVMPLVRIGGVDVCADVVSVSWGTGSSHWADELNGQTASVELRGRYGATQGQPLVITAPTSPTAPLWSGIIDQVTEDLEGATAGYTTRVTAVDNVAFMGRQRMEWSAILPVNRLPGRLADLRPLSRITYRAKWSGILTARYPQLQKRQNTSGDKQLVGKTYMDMVNEALQGSITFAYTARDGAIVYGPPDAPGWSGVVSTAGAIDLSAGIDCAGRADVDRANLDGIVNRWTYGDGEALDVRQGASMEAYGEHSYSTPAGTLVDYTFWPVIINPLASPPTGLQFGMDDPATSIEVEIPITDPAQKSITAEPLDLARFEGVLYAILGVRHEATYRGEWHTTLMLDRNPWITWGGTPP